VAAAVAALEVVVAAPGMSPSPARPSRPDTSAWQAVAAAKAAAAAAAKIPTIHRMSRER